MMNTSPIGSFGLTSVLGVALMRYFEKRTAQRREALLDALDQGALGDQGDGVILWQLPGGEFAIYVAGIALATWDGSDRIKML